MYKENQIFELFIGYSLFNNDKQEMKANSTVTLVKGENKTVLVNSEEKFL